MTSTGPSSQGGVPLPSSTTTQRPTLPEAYPRRSSIRASDASGQPPRGLLPRSRVTRSSAQTPTRWVAAPMATAPSCRFEVSPTTIMCAPGRRGPGAGYRAGVVPLNVNFCAREPASTSAPVVGCFTFGPAASAT